MKVFKFYCGELHYVYASQTKEEAIEQFEEEIGDLLYTDCEEIPESDWDEPTINIWEDNDFDTEPFKISIRESIIGKEPQLISTNNLSIF